MHTKWFKKHFTGLMSLLILTGAMFFVPWQSVGDTFVKLDPRYLLLFLILALAYLLAKAYRFNTMLAYLGHDLPLVKGGLLYLSAQHFTFLPGGELLRTKALKEYADVPIRLSTVAIVQQGLVEAMSLLVVAVLSSFLIGKGVALLLAATIAFGLFLYASRTKGWILNPKFLAFLDWLPGVSLNKTALGEFVEGNQQLISWPTLPKLMALSFIPITAGIGMIFVASLALGQHLSLLSSSIAYVLPAALAYVAVIPGAGEGGTVGILILLGLSVGAAVSLTLMTRILILGLNFIIGPFCLILLKRYYHGNQ